MMMLMSDVLAYNEACACERVPGRKPKLHGPISDQPGAGVPFSMLQVNETLE